MYELANAILEEKRREAHAVRLASEMRKARKASRRSERRVTTSKPEHWVLEWTTTGVTGKRVTMHNLELGEHPTGRDPGDWDRALGRAAGLVA